MKYDDGRGEAIVCVVERITNAGAGSEYLVRLPNGETFSTGADKDRAEQVIRYFNLGREAWNNGIRSGHWDEPTTHAPQQ